MVVLNVDGASPSGHPKKADNHFDYQLFNYIIIDYCFEWVSTKKNLSSSVIRNAASGFLFL